MLVEALLFGALIFLLWQSLRKPPGLPPGRWGLPLVGYIPLTRKSLEDQLQDLWKQHGDIFLGRLEQWSSLAQQPPLLLAAASRPWHGQVQAGGGDSAPCAAIQEEHRETSGEGGADPLRPQSGRDQCDLADGGKILIKHADMMVIKETFFTYFYEEIEHHRATLDPDNPRDLIDGYLLEMEERKDDPETTCSDGDLAFVLFDLFLAGSDTTIHTFTWISGYLASYPNVQRKLHAEIDAVLPKGVLATLADKPKMPYLEAVVNEVMRMISLVKFGVQHAANRNTELGGYTIPKGTILNTSVFIIHSDSRYWDQPEKFMPERWLDEAGKFVSKKEGFLPFGVGKHSCIGENLSRVELFIFLTIIYQSFSVAPPPGKTIDLTPDNSSFLFHLPKFHDLVFTARQ
ncbi:cytochrome P450 2L1-like isoform X2 [Eriocheir sinensis]|uniref:cytochrome P450 2L1-like isoform X2 n=1 Tax=Eriocheir sinensis TaxID=95602 RepID=UPI0021CA4BC7|nr:cytochrome P450 2L1-like isoform X2 [Eriocheir sinensis]